MYMGGNACIKLIVTGISCNRQARLIDIVKDAGNDEKNNWPSLADYKSFLAIFRMHAPFLLCYDVGK